MSARAHIAAAWAAIELLSAGAVQAQALRDPTRPPGSAVARGEGSAPEAGGLVLQSVLVSPERRSAIISGRVVHLGESADGYRLIAVGEAEAVIRTGTQSRTLRLYPSVDLRKPRQAGPVPEEASPNRTQTNGGRAGDGG